MQATTHPIANRAEEPQFLHRRPYYLKSKKARENPNFDDYCVWQDARETSAAPTFFPTARFPEK